MQPGQAMRMVSKMFRQLTRLMLCGRQLIVNGLLAVLMALLAVVALIMAMVEKRIKRKQRTMQMKKCFKSAEHHKAVIQTARCYKQLVKQEQQQQR